MSNKMMEMEAVEEVVSQQAESFEPSYTADMLDKCWPAPVVLPSGSAPRRVFGCMTEPCRNKIHRRVKH
ncbi:MAG: hypothetical protein WCD07_03525 [Burkholderiales bacterium]